MTEQSKACIQWIIEFFEDDLAARDVVSHLSDDAIEKFIQMVGYMRNVVEAGAARLCPPAPYDQKLVRVEYHGMTLTVSPFLTFDHSDVGKLLRGADSRCLMMNTQIAAKGLRAYVQREEAEVDIEARDLAWRKQRLEEQKRKLEKLKAAIAGTELP